MVKSILDAIREHPVWSLAWGLFTASVVFCAGEYNTAQESELVFAREVLSVKLQRQDISVAFELMRQQQAFFSVFRKFEDSYTDANLPSLPRNVRKEGIEHHFDQFDLLRSRLGETIAELRSANFDHPHLNHARDLFLADLLVADELLAERLALLERARKDPRVLSGERQNHESILYQERVRRMWDAVDSRGALAQLLLVRVLTENETEASRLAAKEEANKRREYIQWAAEIYLAGFVIAFPAWLILRRRKARKDAAVPATARPSDIKEERKPESTTPVPNPPQPQTPPPKETASRPAASPIPAASAVPVNPQDTIRAIINGGKTSSGSTEKKP